jgi:ATP-binding cassette subfamily F protein 3
MRQALAVALQDYEGAVVLVSHDRHLLRVNSDKLILVANGRATEFQGSVDDYPKWLAEHNRGGAPSDDAERPEDSQPQNTASAKKEQKRIDAERRKELQPLTSKIKRAERVMEKVGAERSAIETQLADTELYADENKDKLKKLLTDQAYLQKELDQAEADWLQATEAHEELSESLKASE